MSSLALYTTMYPSGEPFWGPFLESVAAQKDRDFTLWIGVDALEPHALREQVQAYVEHPVRLSTGGGTPCRVRKRALDEITREHQAVLLVDSDDVLHASRVQSARAALERDDLSACALELIDSQGRTLGKNFCPPSPNGAASLLPYVNVFGFSNTAYRCDVLQRCLPDTDDVELMDWHVATRAWLRGANITFSSETHMGYRQHGDNTAGVLGPFSASRIRADIPRVLHHYDRVLEAESSAPASPRRSAVVQARARLAGYWNEAQKRPDLLAAHAQALDFGPRAPMWWEWVTAPISA